MVNQRNPVVITAPVPPPRATSGRVLSQISPVNDWLFLSGARVVRPSRLNEFKITDIINAALELPSLRMDGVESLCVKMKDECNTGDMFCCFHEVSDHIEKVRLRGGRVLVHCVAGVSRSPALVLAYLVKYGRVTLREAFVELRDIRSIIRPNVSFFRELIAFEESLRGVPSVKLLEFDGFLVPDVCEEEVKLIRSRQWRQVVLSRKNFEHQYLGTF